MLRSRFFWFLVMILIGTGAGLYYGWAVKPLRASASPEMLRQDYKTDYILMVAEVYRLEKDTSLAAVRLGQISSQPALRVVQEAILKAGEYKYSAADLDMLARLAQGLAQVPSGSTP